MTSPYPGAHPVLAHSNKRHPETTRVSGVLCLELRSKTNTIKRAAPCVLRHYMGLGSCVLGVEGSGQYISFLLSQSSWASQVALVVKNPPANAGDLRDRVQSLGQEDSLEKEMAIHSSTLAQKIPWTEEPGGLQSIESHRVRHDWSNSIRSI